MDLLARKGPRPGTSEFDPEIQWRLYLSGLPNYLDSRIRGQSAATGKIARAVQAAELGLIDIFLSLLEEGQLTTVSGDRLSISKFYLVLTSNLGSGDLVKMESAPFAMMERVALDIASQSLRPELFARITERVVFRPL